MLPLHYAIRNLFRVPARFAQIVLGAGLVILLLMLASAFSGGMDSVLRSSGSERNVILLGSGSEESVERSEIKASVPSEIAAAVEGLETELGRAAVSGEVHYNGIVKVPGQEARQGLLRGVTASAMLVHPEVRLIEGSFPRPGEVMVGRLAPDKLRIPDDSLEIGDKLVVEDTELTVSGVFQAPGTVMEAEIWADLGDMLAIAQRDTLSCAVVRLVGGATFADVDEFAFLRLDLELVAMLESDYYGKLSAFYTPLRMMTWVTAILVAAGAIFGGLNTLYAAFSARIREMATLQAVGYGRIALLVSMLQESIIAALIGALVASTVAVLLVDGIAVPFSIGTFTMDISPAVIGVGLGGGFLLAFIGALPPAWTCLARELPAALRS